MQEMDFQLAQAAAYLPPALQMILKKLPPGFGAQIHEIRLRAGQPVALFDGKTAYLLEQDGRIGAQRNGRAYLFSRQELEATFRAVCEYSVHSFQEEIKQGFVTLKGGHRAGLCGTCLLDHGQVIGLKEISSINLRIARQMLGSADFLYSKLFSGEAKSVLLIGQAGSGKTTVLRDLIRQLSDGKNGTSYKVAVIDERGELSASYHGVSQNQLGYNADVYHLYPKHIGMSMALRTMSPQIIACDEISTEDDIEVLLQSMNAGAKVLATIHGSSLAEVSRRGKLSVLLKAGVFDAAAVLSGTKAPGTVAEIISLREAGTWES